MKELVVISGKGGTGKTSVVASFASLPGRKVIADCDVDAADLHLVLSPSVVETHDFSGGVTAILDQKKCDGSGKCLEVCRFEAVSRAHVNGKWVYSIDSMACDGCGVCAHFCPSRAIAMQAVESGKWFVSDTKHGPLVHARLGIAEESSGKLVTRVRTEAQRVAEDGGFDLIVVDGSPGIGCPVIASITGVDLALIVTEPALSGQHDLKRVAEVASGLKVSTAVCINKWDINLEAAQSIQEWCHGKGIPVVGLIPYDDAVTVAQVMGLSVVECSDGGAASCIIDLWTRVSGMLGA